MEFFLKSEITGGTLLYVGTVLVVYQAEAFLINSSISPGGASKSAISLNHFLALLTSPLNKSFVKDLYQL
jgi:hypothetical protein